MEAKEHDAWFSNERNGNPAGVSETELKSNKKSRQSPHAQSSEHFAKIRWEVI
ncbi:hypothetical protein KSZ_12270 [Dictyobacter formicarum]|uniref:Uncharacterized protein n=1 Tax=Dictyobacter formicarum TaxID=2778368 RepID=A0ABQ3VDJ1_9CHLR|nr:hypothetical protein KSZ_12270 [Dictyobacter formicarum]